MSASTYNCHLLNQHRPFFFKWFQINAFRCTRKYILQSLHNLCITMLDYSINISVSNERKFPKSFKSKKMFISLTINEAIFFWHLRFTLHRFTKFPKSPVIPLINPTNPFVLNFDSNRNLLCLPYFTWHIKADSE